MTNFLFLLILILVGVTSTASSLLTIKVDKLYDRLDGLDIVIYEPVDTTDYNTEPTIFEEATEETYTQQEEVNETENTTPSEWEIIHMPEDLY